MNAKCPHCGSVFRIDPEKVPAGGVRVRCSICRGVFAVQREQPAGHDEPAAVPARSAAPAAPEPAAAPATAPQVTTGPEPAAGFPAFGGADPHAKARRLARALASDIATYFPERRERALREGTLRSEFREEITKSWKEYAEQVGTEVAHGTSYFRDALNEILARGQRVF